MKLRCFILFFLCVMGIQLSLAQKQTNHGFTWYKVENHGRFGATNQEGVEIVPARYKSISYMEHDVLEVKDFRDHIGQYFLDGRVYIPCDYLSISNYISNGFLVSVATTVDGDVDIYDKSGNIIYPRENGISGVFCYESNIGKVYCAPYKDKTWAIFDYSFHQIIANGRYTEMLPMLDSRKNMYYLLMDGNKAHFFDALGKEFATISCRFAQIAKDERNKEYFYIPGAKPGRMELDGTITTYPTSGEVAVQSFAIGGKTFVGYLNGCKFGVKNQNGSLVLPYEYDNLYPTQDGIRIFEGKYSGWANENGKVLIPADKYFNVYKLGELIYAENMDKKNRAIYSADGKLLVSDKYGYASGIFETFNGSYTAIKKDGAYALFKLMKDAAGSAEQLTPFVYTDFYTNYDKTGFMYPMDNDGKLGILREDGQLLLAPKYQKITYISKDKYFKVFDGDYVGVVLSNGCPILEPGLYTSISYNSSNNRFIAQVGNRRSVIDANGNVIEDSNPNAEFNRFVSLADLEFEHGHYNYAFKYYDEANKIKNTASLLFNMGVCQYNQDKYRNAINYFERCLDSNPSQSLRSRTYSLIDKSQDALNQRRVRGAQIAFNVLGFICGVSNAILQSRNSASVSSYSSSSYNSSSRSSYYGSSSSSSSSSSSVSSSAPKTQTQQYECACFHSPTFGIDSYHNCPNCGASHKFGTLHTCTKK